MCKGYASAQEAYDRQEPTEEQPERDWCEAEDRQYERQAEGQAS